MGGGNSFFTPEGVFNGFTSIAGTHSPGNSPGLETFNAGLSYGSTSTLVWELSANTDDPAFLGSAWDAILLAGGNLTIANGATMSLVFSSPLADGTPSSVNWADAFWDESRSWAVIGVDVDNESAFWNGNLFTSIVVGNDASGISLATARPDAAFSVSRLSAEGFDYLMVNYVVVPEPGSLALAGLGIALAWGLHRRAKKPRKVA
jgi:hypothetical protein